MGLVSTLNFIMGHRLNADRPAVARFAPWQIGSRLMNAPIAVPYVDQAHLLVSRGMTWATQNINCGLQEFEDMAFVLHALREGHIFVDVGAYTVLAGGAVGAECVTIEPIPATFPHYGRFHSGRKEYFRSHGLEVVTSVDS